MREQRPTAVIACFHDWDGFGRLVERGAPSVIEHGEGPTNTMARAIACLCARQPNFLFIHLDHVDHAGHTRGWNSREYIAAVEAADRLIGQAIDALSEVGMTKRTVVLITADYGGKGKKHGGMTMDEIEIPWILWGSGVAHGKELKTHVNIYDTAPTIAYALGLKTPDCWIGKPVIEAFLPRRPPNGRSESDGNRFGLTRPQFGRAR